MTVWSSRKRLHFIRQKFPIRSQILKLSSSLLFGSFLIPYLTKLQIVFEVHSRDILFQPKFTFANFNFPQTCLRGFLQTFTKIDLFQPRMFSQIISTIFYFYLFATVIIPYIFLTQFMLY